MVAGLKMERPLKAEYPRLAANKETDFSPTITKN